MTNLHKQRKYTIYQKLNQLPHDEYRIAKHKLPMALKVNKRTFLRWVYLYKDERLEIPADKLAIIAKFLGCSVDEMFNYEIPQFNIAALRRLNHDQLAKDLNLVI